MNDGYEEILVQRQKSAADTLIKGGVIALAAVPVALGILFASPLFLLIGAVIGVLAYYFILPNFDLEYEYMYVNGDIDIDKIMSKRKRKKVGSYTKDNLEIMAPTGSSQLASYLKSGKVLDYTSGDPQKKTWTLVFGTERSSDIVKLELTDAIAQDMRRYAPRKVFFS